jgi:plasmid stabilization system protein ParE
VEDPVLNAWGIRLTLVKDYLAFYVISEDEKRVCIVRFLHSRQNWAAILRHGFSFE